MPSRAVRLISRQAVQPEQPEWRLRATTGLHLIRLADNSVFQCEHRSCNIVCCWPNGSSYGHNPYKLLFGCMAGVTSPHALDEFRPVILLQHLDQPVHLAALDHALALTALFDAIERQLHIEGFVGGVADRGEDGVGGRG